jgi:hypothetical protein
MSFESVSIESIKEAIAELGAEEKASLTAWLIEQDAAEWDRQMEEDCRAAPAWLCLKRRNPTSARAGQNPWMK